MVLPLRQPNDSMNIHAAHHPFSTVYPMITSASCFPTPYELAPGFRLADNSLRSTLSVEQRGLMDYLSRMYAIDHIKHQAEEGGDICSV
jgi:hypothetical protein